MTQTTLPARLLAQETIEVLDGACEPRPRVVTRHAIEDANRQMQSGSDEMLAMGTALTFGMAIGMLFGGAPRLLVAGALVPAAAMVITLFTRAGWNRSAKPRSMQGA